MRKTARACGLPSGASVPDLNLLSNPSQPSPRRRIRTDDPSSYPNLHLSIRARGPMHEWGVGFFELTTETLGPRDYSSTEPSSSQLDFAKTKTSAAVNPFAILFYPMNEFAAGVVTRDRYGTRRQSQANPFFHLGTGASRFRRGRGGAST